MACHIINGSDNHQNIGVYKTTVVSFSKYFKQWSKDFIQWRMVLIIIGEFNFLGSERVCLFTGGAYLNKGASKRGILVCLLIV